jgi:hypothetical protein
VTLLKKEKNANFETAAVTRDYTFSKPNFFWEESPFELLEEI